ncbi:MAG: phage tail protein, partial [Pleurocapsa sp. MO_226.B13]|nr:phage tail protein [Pleurocapsa sp. MO_226.B13]
MSGIGEALLISAATSLITAGLTYALTPTQKLEAGRLNDLTSSNSSYGVSLPWAWGTVRLPGNKIWLDYLEEQRKTSSGGKGSKVQTTEYSYYGYYASVFCECPFRSIVDYQRLWMNKKLVYSTIGGAETIAQGGKFADRYLRFYKGDPAQIIDPLLSNTTPISNYNYGLPTNEEDRDAYLGSLGIDPNAVILTPSYNYRAYMVAQRLPLEDFFNALPADEAQIIASENCSVGQIIGDIFSLFFAPTRYDVSLLTTPVQGFTIDNVTAAKQAIQTLQQAYFFDIVDSNGVFKFIPLNYARNVINLSPLDLAAHPAGNQKPLDYEIIEKDPATLPSEVIVKYLDPDLDYDVNEQRSQLDVKSHYNPNPVTLSFSLVLTASEAATIADRALILAWLSKYTYKFQLPPAHLTLEPTDLIANVFDDGDYPIKITQTRIGANLIVDCEGVPHDTYFWDLVRILESGDLTVGVADYNVVIETNGTVSTIADTSGTTYTEGTDYMVDLDGNVSILSTGNIAEGTDLIISTTAEPTPDLVTIVSAGDTELL